MPKAIHQFLAGYSTGDAISNEARVLRKLFRSWDYDSEIFCDPECILPELKSDCHDVTKYNNLITPDDIVFHHLSIGCKANQCFAEAHCKKALLYHNITPAEYFRFINAEIANQLATGRDQMKQLAGVAQINLADSRYNANELESIGYGTVGVLPLVLDLSMLTDKPDPITLRDFDDDMVNVLFVGRVAPNKAVEDLLHAFYYYQKYINPNARFIHVGSSSGVDSYRSMMELRAKELDLKNIYFAGTVTQPQLNAWYQVADVFLCMSEHEGFGIPLIEAMHKDLPVLAYDCTAVGDTMNGAGVLVNEKIWPDIAEMIHQLATNIPLRETILKGQRARIHRYQNRNLGDELKTHLAPLLEV